MAAGSAHIGKPVPDFQATAVVNGEFKEVKLSDYGHIISKDYGVPEEEDGAAYRGPFIIDNKGMLHQITINDLPVGRCVDEVLRLAFQFIDQHGEVCPAGWRLAVTPSSPM
ncbi:hypothetical protein GDO78_008316 [Eleutherodactylus coqui]|uniref:thioredoxin-dependent peroxiredoxin n=1 Tax=Eleutherodactylus coqui TaxID=57060 RepID=A0A8J6KDS0_ELECQ|nr:hypothetical protein GDO78_008316 [Eleutherodactylus coqui]